MPATTLVVDDHPLTRDALAALLAQNGFDVVGEAADGEAAVASARRLQPQLVLLDLSMPGVDGLTALPRLREAAPECEVVVLTASGTEANLVAAVLSAREVEVLLLLDDHVSTDDIAKRLFISEHTVRSHVQSLLRKLGVSSRRQALE